LRETIWKFSDRHCMIYKYRINHQG
jgi:hypothetical protein